eukprot:TRINITY_DN2932_c0_g1_i6.p1 TRINITY_DN2932_c0_g1~~TRINITY_DN2932_c0_g1_i6.p1  ORF type:complete len:427 (-),score=41.10 TRINITY_DN2932_c0_g1_i6:408-1688(-)
MHFIWWTFFLLATGQQCQSQSWTQQAILTASNKAADDQFGMCVAITDNYALVSAHGAAAGTLTDAGLAYIFSRNGDSWAEQQILSSSNRAASDLFGRSVSLTDNYALVGAHYANPGSVSDAGSAYVFVRNQTIWIEQAILTASNKASSDNFGYAVSLTDNYALAGAFQADAGTLSNAGSAYVYARSGTSWNQISILTASNKAAADNFGFSVALTDTYVLVGSYCADVDLLLDSGAAYIYLRSGNTYSEESILTASNKATGDKFGHAVALSSTYAVVGAPFADIGTFIEPGIVYVFTKNGVVWTESTFLTASTKFQNARLGFSVGASDVYVLAGAYQADPGSVGDAGAAYVYSFSGTAWIEQAILTASNKLTLDRLGWFVAITNYYAIAGAYQADPGGLNAAGAAYIYRSPGKSPIRYCPTLFYSMP